MFFLFGIPFQGTWPFCWEDPLAHFLQVFRHLQSLYDTNVFRSQ